MILQPIPPEKQRLRYSTWPFPAYRFLPGHHPHPRRNPEGHSYGMPEPNPTVTSPTKWQSSSWYLYGIDLYNYCYWWECHEVFEALWHGAGHETEQGLFFRGIIQVAASNLKYHLHNETASKKLIANARKFLEPIPDHYMGLNVPTFLQNIQSALDTRSTFPALITLQTTIQLQDDRS